MFPAKRLHTWPLQTIHLSIKLQKPEKPTRFLNSTVVEADLGVTWTLKAEVDADGNASTELSLSIPNNLYTKTAFFTVKTDFIKINGVELIKSHSSPFRYEFPNGVSSLAKRFTSFENGLSKYDSCVMYYDVEIHGHFHVVRIQRMRDFGQGEHGLTDVVLIVGKKRDRFHVSKAILATHSSYFQTMFFGAFRESGQSEIELKDINAETFQQLLEILYLCPNIHENNVENLLDLARIYDAQPVTAQCRKFINGENAIPREEKKRLIEEYFGK